MGLGRNGTRAQRDEGVTSFMSASSGILGLNQSINQARCGSLAGATRPHRSYLGKKTRPLRGRPAFKFDGAAGVARRGRAPSPTSPGPPGIDRCLLGADGDEPRMVPLPKSPDGHPLKLRPVGPRNSKDRAPATGGRDPARAQTQKKHHSPSPGRPRAARPKNGYENCQGRLRLSSS